MKPRYAARRSTTRRTAFLPFALLALAALLPAGALQAAGLDPDEERIAQFVIEHTERTIDFLERTVNVNSGTLNIEGNREVARIMTPEFERLGFDVEWAALPPEMERAGHLIATRRGSQGKRLLLIGHLDTVFEPDHPLQTFERDGDFARGPGVIDMKGGNAVILLALEALDSVGALDDTTITVIFTGDEESPGRPLETSRRHLWDAGDASDIALGFEPGSVIDGIDHAVVARRSSSSWRLEVAANTAHSSTIFRDDVGAGALFEASRILDTWYGELRGEQYLTFNAGLLVGGAEARYDAAAGRGSASGKSNVIPAKVIAMGDIRTISAEQLHRARERMQHVVASGLPGTASRLEFTDGYPSMFPTDANYQLLARYAGVSRDLGYGDVVPFDPGARGAADIAFVAHQVEAGLDGLGPSGSGSHTSEELIDLRSIPKAAQRAAILMYRLTR